LTRFVPGFPGRKRGGCRYRLSTSNPQSRSRGEHERFWLEEVVAIGNDGGKPLFSWGFGPLTREG
jgi:hypothetical protein